MPWSHISHCSHLSQSDLRNIQFAGFSSIFEFWLVCSQKLRLTTPQDLNPCKSYNFSRLHILIIYLHLFSTQYVIYTNLRNFAERQFEWQIYDVLLQIFKPQNDTYQVCTAEACLKYLYLGSWEYFASLGSVSPPKL